MDPVRPVLLFAFMFSLIDVLGQDLFAPEVPIGPNIAGIESPLPCDIDGDGLNEVILGSTRHGEVVALKFDGDTVSSLLRLLPDQAPSDLMLVVDMNLDGHPDLIRSRLSGDTALQIPRIAVYLGQVGGSFMEPIFRQGAYSLNGAMADDLTGDGHAEIIVQDDYGFHVYVLDEDAGEIELLRTFDQFQPGAKVSTGDVTGDGVPDLIFATSEWWYSSIEYWDATLGPDAPLVLLDSSFGEIGPLGHADFNGDGLTDLFAGGGPGFSHTSCLFWTQTAGSTFVRTVDTLDFFFSDNFQFRSAQDGTSMYYDRYGNLTHVRIHPDLTFGPPDTLHLQPTNPLSFCLADMDGDTAAELLTISRDGRLSMAHGLMAPDTFGIPVEVFSWNDGYTGPMVAIDPGQDATEELAFMSNQFDYPHLTLLHSLVPDPQKPVPAMTRTPMATGDWRQGHAEMQLMDIDSDGDSGLVGYMDFFGPYTPCQIFCMEPTGGTFAGHCLGTGLVQPTGLNAYRFDQLTIFDVNGDGPKDLLMEGTWVDLMVPAVQDPDEFVLTQTAPLLFELASAPMAIADYAMHHDLDEDGLEELLVQANPSELTVYHNDGGGNFTALPPLTTDHYVTGTWVDMNQDGVLDNIWSS
ncbi:MAG: VCBS repeat-containing protein, partial [Flavobacteriales bacterium]|nr:VCBS repeat-containing protein [Flavobacteriales bacterium]